MARPFQPTAEKPFAKGAILRDKQTGEITRGVVTYKKSYGLPFVCCEGPDGPGGYQLMYLLKNMELAPNA